MSLSVYTKNVCGNWLVSSKKKLVEKKSNPELVESMSTISLTLSQAFLAPNVDSKYKFNLSGILIKYFKAVKSWSTKSNLLKF